MTTTRVVDTIRDMLRLIKYLSRLLYRGWGPVFLYAGLIFYISGRSLPAAPVYVPFFDKIAHFFEYALLGGLVYRALKNSSVTWGRKKRAFLSVLLTMLYAFSDEVHQFYVPNRLMSAGDFLADALGAIAVVMVIEFISKQKSEQPQGREPQIHTDKH